MFTSFPVEMMEPTLQGLNSFDVFRLFGRKNIHLLVEVPLKYLSDEVSVQGFSLLTYYQG